MKDWFKKLDIEEKQTIVGVFLMILGSYISYSGINRILKIVICAILTIIGSIILIVQNVRYYKEGKYTSKQKKLLLILAVLGSIVIHREDAIYTSLVIAANFVGKDLKKLMKIVFYSCIVSFIFVSSLFIFGFAVNKVTSRDFFDVSIYRSTLGFSHPNLVFRFYMPIVLSGLFIFKDNIYYVLIALLLGVGLFFITGSRGGLLTLICLFILCIVPKKIKNKLYNVKVIPYIFLFFTFVTLILAIIFHDGDLNDYGSGRFNIWYTYINDISVFGKVHKINKWPLDNMYLHTLYYGGMYGYIYYYAIYVLAFINQNKKNSKLVFILFLSTFIYGFFENFSSFGESQVLIIMMSLILNYDKIDELNDENVEIKCQ